FVRAHIEGGVRPGAMLVPQRAVQLSQQGASVMIVGPDDTALSRPVTLGDMRGDSWIVLDGLEAGDRVIIDGLQKVQPNQPVRIAAPGEGSATEAADSAPGASGDRRSAGQRAPISTKPPEERPSAQ